MNDLAQEQLKETKIGDYGIDKAAMFYKTGAFQKPPQKRVFPRGGGFLGACVRVVGKGLRNC